MGLNETTYGDWVSSSFFDINSGQEELRICKVAALEIEDEEYKEEAQKKLLKAAKIGARLHNKLAALKTPRTVLIDELLQICRRIPAARHLIEHYEAKIASITTTDETRTLAAAMLETIPTEPPNDLHTNEETPENSR